MAVALFAGTLASGCRAVVPGLGANLAGARATADGLFGGIATRFDRVFREPKVRDSRRLIVRNVLTPSRVFADTAAWTWSPSATAREVVWRGLAEPNRYRFVADRSPAPPGLAGETRHDFRLQKLGDDVFEWVEKTDFGMGSTTPDALAGIPVAWIAAGERPDSAALRADLHSTFPNSTREWGRVFGVASLQSSRDASGAWVQRHTFVLRTKRASETYPAFAKWLRDYVSPLRMHIRLHDATRTWFDAIVRNDSLVVRLRSQGGHLLPLEGGTAAFPDTLTLETDVSAKLMIFRIGFRALRAEFVTVHQPAQRGWSIRFTEEPDWQLPLLTEQMLRSPLKRPFAGAGSLFRIVAARDSAAPQSMLTRNIVLPVQESVILRFLARLANAGVSAYIGDGADRDMALWLTAAFTALRDDSRAVLSSLEMQTPSR
jgi:hypothetical protein